MWEKCLPIRVMLAEKSHDWSPSALWNSSGKVFEYSAGPTLLQSIFQVKTNLENIQHNFLGNLILVTITNIYVVHC